MVFLDRQMPIFDLSRGASRCGKDERTRDSFRAPRFRATPPKRSIELCGGYFGCVGRLFKIVDIGSSSDGTSRIAVL